jgi:MFS family permease
MHDPNPGNQGALPSMIPRGIPRTVWSLGFVSLFMDVSSEMVHSLLPLFLVTVLGASATRVGLIEGIAEGTALIVKIFSGALSDKLRNRKALALLGYGMGAASKPLFALASGVGIVFGARFIDRIGKGIRGAPRDALIADVTPREIRGAAYGLRQSLDTVGALLGPVAALVLMKATGGDYRMVFWMAAVPGFMAVAILAAFVREPAHAVDAKAPSPIRLADLKGLRAGFWLVTALGAFMSLARFSEAFLLMRGQSAGMDGADAPILMVIMNVVYFLTAYPVGRLSDRIGRGGLLAAGVLTLVVADVTLAAADRPWLVGLGTALWGLQMGLTQGIFSAFIADNAPPALRGTAFGLFNLAAGIATVGASVIAGLAWDRVGAAATFGTGAAFAGLALVFYAVFRTRLR